MLLFCCVCVIWQLFKLYVCTCGRFSYLVYVQMQASSTDSLARSMAVHPTTLIPTSISHSSNRHLHHSRCSIKVGSSFVILLHVGDIMSLHNWALCAAYSWRKLANPNSFHFVELEGFDDWCSKMIPAGINLDWSHHICCPPLSNMQ